MKLLGSLVYFHYFFLLWIILIHFFNFFTLLIFDTIEFLPQVWLPQLLYHQNTHSPPLWSLIFFPTLHSPLPDTSDLWSAFKICLWSFAWFLRYPHLSETTGYLSFFFWFILLSVIPFNSMLLLMTWVCFYDWVIFCCIYVQHLIDLFIFWGI